MNPMQLLSARRMSKGFAKLVSYASVGLMVAANFLMSAGTAQAVVLPPAAPTNIFLIPTSPTVLQVRWQDNATDETGFPLAQSMDGFNFVRLPMDYPHSSPTAASIGSQGPYNLSSLSPNTRYWYEVAATNANGDSAFIVSAPKYTWANIPNQPVVTNVQATSFDVAIALPDGNPDAGLAPTAYSIKVDDPLTLNPALKTRYVQPNGTLGPSEFFDTAANWGTKHVSGNPTFFTEVDPNTIYRWARAGNFPASKIGKEWRVLRSDVIKFIESKKKRNQFLTEQQEAFKQTKIKCDGQKEGLTITEQQSKCFYQFTNKYKYNIVYRCA